MSFFTLNGFQHFKLDAEELLRTTNLKNPYPKIGARKLADCFNFCLAPGHHLFREDAEGIYSDKMGFAYVLTFTKHRSSLSLSCRRESSSEEFVLELKKKPDGWWWGSMKSGGHGKPITISAQLVEVPSLSFSGPMSKRMRK